MTVLLDRQSGKWLAKMEALFKACADQTRLRILNMLAEEGEVCVCHFVEVLKTNQPKVSRHLAYLKRAGLVTDRKEGLWVYYRLASPLSIQAEKVLSCLTSCCVDVPELEQDRMTLQTILREQSLEKLKRQIPSLLPVITAAEPEKSSEIQIELL